MQHNHLHGARVCARTGPGGLTIDDSWIVVKPIFLWMSAWRSTPNPSACNQYITSIPTASDIDLLHSSFHFCKLLKISLIRHLWSSDNVPIWSPGAIQNRGGGCWWRNPFKRWRMSSQSWLFMRWQNICAWVRQKYIGWCASARIFSTSGS